MAYPKNVWNQLRGITADRLIKALKKDGWILDKQSGATSGSILTYIKDERLPVRVVQVHWHPKKTYGPRLLKSLLADTGWTENDMRRLKLIK